MSDSPSPASTYGATSATDSTGMTVVGDGTLNVIAAPIDGTQATVHLAGELDLSSADLISAVLDHQLALGRRSVRLDLSRLTFMDCAGLRALVRAHHRFLAARGTLVLTDVGARVARVLAITRLDEMLLLADGPVEPLRARRLRSANMIR